jgi:CheY-like chemotaxis protein
VLGREREHRSNSDEDDRVQSFHWNFPACFEIGSSPTLAHPKSTFSMAKKILIVDDNEHLRQILSSILRFSGYEISEAATGTQAIEKAVSAKPNLILMDLDLPDMTGIDAAQTISKDPRTAHIPIVGCSSFSGWDWREKALCAGMVDYMEKPVHADVIRAKIEEFILSER